MQNPAFVTLNNHRIKVQRWHRDSNAITFTTVIRGENLGDALVSVTEAGTVELGIDDEEPLTGSIKITDRRASGAGPTAVHRIEFHFVPDQSASAPELSSEQKLDLILKELQTLRREVATLRGIQSPQVQPGITPPRPGTTMLDFEIPTDGNDSGE